MERADADALLVRDRAGEDKFVADGYGIDRRDVMYNDFVIVGPRSDPAGIRSFRNARDAFARIATVHAAFASRGDDSGTNRMELRLWKSAGIESDKSSTWYRELGQGMGPTLNIAAGLDAYTLTDRATWAVPSKMPSAPYDRARRSLVGCERTHWLSRHSRPTEGPPSAASPVIC